MKTLAKWSVEDYHRMIESGILRDRQVELLAGEIVEMSPETPIHYNTARRGAKYLETLLVGKAEVRFNGPIPCLTLNLNPILPLCDCQISTTIAILNPKIFFGLWKSLTEIPASVEQLLSSRL